MNAFPIIQEFAKTLRNLDQWLVKATEHAKKKNFDVNVLVDARLAPDQYPLVRQVQSACDTTKFCAAYLSGKEAPAHPDNEKTFEELHARITKCLAFVDSVKEADYKGFEDRKVAPKWLEGKWIKGNDYLVQMAIPNFFFHATTAYAILRHNGVDVGKMDFIGQIPVQG
jgi:hypothetical protein